MTTIRFALILLLLSPASLAAQDVLGFSLGGGFAFALGESSETYGNGPTVSAATHLPLSERLSISATIGYQELRILQDEALTERDYDPSVFRLGGGFIEGGNQRVLAILGHAQLHLLPRSGRLSPYLLAGAGLSQVRRTDLEIYFLGEWENEPGASETALAADVGAGIQLRFTEIVSAFAQGSYQRVFTDGGTSMAPIRVGILLELGPN
jgi:hypothetical protein